MNACHLILSFKVRTKETLPSFNDKHLQCLRKASHRQAERIQSPLKTLLASLLLGFQPIFHLLHPAHCQEADPRELCKESMPLGLELGSANAEGPPEELEENKAAYPSRLVPYSLIEARFLYKTLQVPLCDLSHSYSSPWDQEDAPLPHSQAQRR